MQHGYYQGNPPPYERPGSSVPPPHIHRQGPPPPPPPQTPSNFGAPYQHPAPNAQYPPYLYQQPWSGPPPSAPPLSHVPASNYNPNSYGPMPGSAQSPISPIRQNQGVGVGVVGPSTFNPGLDPTQPLHHGSNQSYSHGASSSSLQQNYPTPPPPPPPPPPSQQQNYINQGPPSQTPVHTLQPYPPPQPERPPLPPRPGSIVQPYQHQSYPLPNHAPVQFQQPAGGQAPQQTRQSYLATSLAQGQGDHQNQGNPYTHDIRQSQVPPPPPPLPQGYQIEVQQNQQGQPQHPPYSNHPPSHAYEPQAQNALGHGSFNDQAHAHNHLHGGYGVIPPPQISQTPGPHAIKSPAPPTQPAGDDSQQFVQHVPNNASAGVNQDIIGPNSSQPPRAPPVHAEQPAPGYNRESNNLHAGITSPSLSGNEATWRQHQQSPPVPNQSSYGSPAHGTDSQNHQPLSGNGPPHAFGPASFQQLPRPDQQNHSNLSNPQASQSNQASWNNQIDDHARTQLQNTTKQDIQPSSAHVQKAAQPGLDQERHSVQSAMQASNLSCSDQSYAQYSSSMVSGAQEHPTVALSGLPQQPPAQAIHTRDDSAASINNPVVLDSPRLKPPRMETPASTANTHTDGLSFSSSHQPQQKRSNDQGPRLSDDHQGASALGAGGPSDWEHFGSSEADEIDDIAMFGGKRPDNSLTQTNQFAELSSQPSPTTAVKQYSQSSQISAPSELWPTPPPLAPLQLHGSAAQLPLGTAGQHEQSRFVPTPPPINSHEYKVPSKPPRTVSPENDRHGSIGEALQTRPLPKKAADIDYKTLIGGAPPGTNHTPKSAEDWSDQTGQPAASANQHSQGTENTLHTNQNQAQHGASLSQRTPAQEFVVDNGDWPTEVAKQLITTNPSPFVLKGKPNEQTAPFSQSQDMNDSLTSTKGTIKALGDLKELQDDAQQRVPTFPPPASEAGSVALPAGRESMQWSEPLQNSYARLEPWYKGSLERYAAMLQSESQAATDQERTSIFTDFMMTESRLREVRYGPAIGTGITASHERSNLQPTTTKIQIKTVEEAPLPSSVQRNRVPSPISSAESYVVDSADDGDFSPGGRPRLARVAPTRATHPNTNPSGDSERKTSMSNPAGGAPMHKSRAASEVVPSSIALQESTTALRPSSPDRIIHDTVTARNSVSDKPAYKPFRYNADPSTHPNASDLKNTGSPKPADFDPPRSEYKAYSPGKTSSSGQVPVSQLAPVSGQSLQKGTYPDGRKDLAGTTTVEQGNAFANDSLMLQATSKSTSPGVQSRQALPGSQKPHQSTAESKVYGSDNGTTLEMQLQSVLPMRKEPTEMSTQALDPVRQAIEVVPDHFEFIEDLARSWNLEAKKLRDRNDNERRMRQEEQDEHTSRLFDEESIGYGDLGALDDEFKQSETEKKSQEDRAECRDFVAKVFDPVYNRLQEQIQQLMEQYVYCIDLMKDAVTGKEALEAKTERPALVPVVDAFLNLHRKIELRHRKVSDAIINRDRRFGKTEVQLLYHIGNINGMKQMERHFAEAERKAILEAAKKSEARAKGLLDTVEENTIKAVEINQDYMDAIMQTIRRPEVPVPSTTDASTQSFDSDSLQRALVTTQTVLQSLTSSSETLMKQYYEASETLNTAEHDVLLAEAKVASADAATLLRLNEERGLQEGKLKQELDHRVAIVQDDSKKANEYIGSLLSQRRRSNAAAHDPQHEDRIKKALEAAKKRNTASPDVYAPPD